MSDLKLIDLTMFGCPMYKIKALQAAETLDDNQSVVQLRVNSDVAAALVKHLETEGFHCVDDKKDTLTSTIEVIRAS